MAQPPKVARFVSQCIVDPLKSAKDREAVVNMCAMHICSLQLSTRPTRRPLLMVNGVVSKEQRAFLTSAGAEVIEAPELPKWNQSNDIWVRRPAYLRGLSGEPG